MQMMADIRMLQEQTQQLQQQLTAAIDQLSATLKTINGRVDDQAAATRKSFADQKLAVDQFGNDLRIVRERIDENTVRITSLSQEVEALRLAIPQFPTAPPAPVDPGAPAVPGTSPDAAAAPAPAAPPVALAAGHVAAASLQHRARRFHRGTMGALHRRLQHLSPKLLTHRSRRRCAVVCRRVLSAGRQVPGSDRRV